MAAIEQEQLLTDEGLAELARQILAEHSVERIKLSSTAKGVRLENLTVHRENGEPWSSVVERAARVYDLIEQQVGQLV